MASATSLHTFSRTSAVRPVSASSSGGVGGAPSLETHEMDLLLWEKAEKLLEKDIGHRSGLETKSKGKDVVIRDLQEIAAMAKKLAQAAVRNEAELTQELPTFSQELGAQTEEITALREQHPQTTTPGSHRAGPTVRRRYLTSSLRAAHEPRRRHGAPREPPPEGLPRRPRRHPLRPRGLRQPAVLPPRGGAQQARPRWKVPGAAGLPRPAAQHARREGGGAQPGAAALLAGLRRAAVPARREAPGAGGVPAAPPHDGHRRREAAPATTARAAARGCPCGRFGRARHRARHRHHGWYRHRALRREAPRKHRAPAGGSPSARGCTGPPGPEDAPGLSVHLTPLKCYLHTLHAPSAAFSRLRQSSLWPDSVHGD